MKILLLGSGGRECAIAWKISQSPRLEHLYVAPGNAAQYGTNVALNPMDFDAVKEFVDANAIDMIVVGPENPLVEGIYDYFADHSVETRSLFDSDAPTFSSSDGRTSWYFPAI